MLFRSNTNELLVFSNIDNNLKAAFKDKINRNLDSVFQSDATPHTVTMQESISRLINFCGINFKPEMQNKINKLEKYRNQITHSEVFLREEDVSQMFEGLIDYVDLFFLEHLEKEYSSVSGYSEFKNNYKQYLEKAVKSQKDIKREVNGKLLNSFSKCGISMGENEAKIGRAHV